MGTQYKNSLLSSAALVALTAGFIACGSDIVSANPIGCEVVVGGADIVSDGDTTTITQHSTKTVINWQSFNINIGETTRFIQPSADSIALNRITDGSPSQILGNLIGNGKVWLVNPNGVFFGASAKIDVAGLIASTADITDTNFSAGNYKFDISGNSDAEITNNGEISIRDAGLAGFVAPHITNNGRIIAKLGKVQLAGADTATLDLYGDGLVELAVTNQDTAKTILQNGVISADGGSVLLKTAAGMNVVDNLISMTGLITANTVEEKNGVIVLSAENGATEISGTLKAESGTIHTLGDTVTVDDTAYFDASGMTGGGTIRIGGGWQGGEGLYSSSLTLIEAGATIKADATGAGNGGSVAVWSDGNTGFKGHISAKGGEASGNGGDVEVSGKNKLGFNGTVDTTAAHGETGNLLLDPTDITISTAADSNVNGATPFSPTGDDVASNLNVTTLQTALAAANVTVQTRATGSQPGDITVANSLTWTSGRTLTLAAAHDININAAVSAGTNGSITLNAGNTVALNANLSGTGTVQIYSSDANVTMGIGDAQAGTLNLDNSELARIVNGWGTVRFGSATGNGTLNFGAYTWNDNVRIDSNNGTINFNGNINVNANSLTITSDTDVNINAPLAGTGTIRFQVNDNSVTYGIGDGQAGTMNFTNAELANITNGWANIIFGTAAAGNINIGTYTAQDKTTYYTGDFAILNGVLSTTETSGNAFTFRFTGDGLTNNYGAGAIVTAGTSRYLVYGLNPAKNTLNGLASDFTRYSCIYAGSCPAMPATGNGILYTTTPVLTVNPAAVGLTYGDAAPNLNGYGYTVSGYLGSDSSADILSGTLNGTTSYTSTSDVGSYNIDYGSGTLTSAMGYGFTYANNASAITVGKAPLTATASSGTRAYGNANPAFTVSYTGFKNGQDSTVIDTLATASSAANATSTAGNYSVIASGALDNNYSFTYVDGTLTVTGAAPPPITPPVVVAPIIPSTAVSEIIPQNGNNSVIGVIMRDIPSSVSEMISLIRTNKEQQPSPTSLRAESGQMTFRDMIIVFDPVSGFDFRKVEEFF